ncbi:MAG: hypothetical protein BM485_08960 [Desulfobulbaceae bacterium DB1]|nr:MAG: hypothetical protein BM485_08960 [Desulfobulbaceae bacterium DB1]
MPFPPCCGGGIKRSWPAARWLLPVPWGRSFPPSIVLILIGDIVGVPVGDLFLGAVLPGLVLVVLYVAYIVVWAYRNPAQAPAVVRDEGGPGANRLRIVKALAPPLVLMVAVLGSLFAGIASPTEAAGVGAVGASLLAMASGRFNLRMVDQVARSTMQLTFMVFIVLVGAAAFGLVFRGTGGDGLVREALHSLSRGLGPWSVLAPVMIDLGIDPVWLCILIAVNLQTSFLTPPFGFSLFYLRAVSPPGVTTAHIYRGVIPFVLLQLTGLLIIALFPGLVGFFSVKPCRTGGRIPFPFFRQSPFILRLHKQGW